MDAETLRRLRRRFVEFAAEYEERVDGGREYILLKRDHSLRVHALASRIVRAEGLEPSQLYVAAALLHDIGRFSQYERFGTYRDDVSVDHGQEGAEVLRAGRFALECSPEERACLLEVVRLHNKKTLPPGLDPLIASVCHVVRDADKLDIVPVVLAQMQPSGPRDQVVTLGLADEPDKWTPFIAKIVAAGESPAYGQFRYLNDFALLLASWGPELVFRASRRLFSARGYLDGIFDLLPGTEAFVGLKSVLAARLAR